MTYSKTITSQKVNLRAMTCIKSTNVPGCRITRQIQYVVRSGSITSLNIPVCDAHLGRYRAHVKIQNHLSPRDICSQTERYVQNLASVTVFCTETLALEDGK